MIRSIDRGFALPAALVAIILVGAVITGGVYAFSSARTAGGETDLASQALLVAEIGLQEALGGSAAAHPEPGPRRPVIVYRDSTGAATATYTIAIQEVSDTLARVTSQGRVRADGEEAVRQVEALIPIRGRPLE